MKDLTLKDIKALLTPYSIFFGFFIFLFSINLIVDIFNSWHWPIYHDAQIFYYAGNKILHGQMPYKDIFMMDMPVVYLINSLGIVLFSVFGDDVGNRLTDLSWLLFTGVLIYHFFKRESKLAGIAGALFFANYHLALGHTMAMQRDFLMSPFLIGSCHFFANYLEGIKPRKSAFISGIFLALACMIKPFPVFMGLMFLIIMFSEKDRPALKVLVHDTLAIGAGFALIIFSLMAWITIGGAMPSFLEMCFKYLPIYNQFGKFPPLGNDIDKFVIFSCLVAIVASTCDKSIRKRNLILMSGCIFSFFHFHLQNIGMMHRLYPMRLFFPLFVFFNFHRMFAAKSLLPRIIVFTILAWSAFIFSVFDMSSPEKFNAHWEYANRRERVADLMTAFEQAAPDINRPHEGRTMHFFDVITGFWYASLVVGSESPSNCFSPYIFYMVQEDPYVQELQRRCIDGLEKAPPKVIALGSFSFPLGQPFLILNNHLARDFLNRHYKLVIDKPNHKIYARK